MDETSPSQPQHELRGRCRLLARVIGAMIEIGADAHRTAFAQRLVASAGGFVWRREIAFQRGGISAGAFALTPAARADDGGFAVREFDGLAGHHFFGLRNAACASASTC